MSDSFYPMDCSPLGSSVHGILQARILEWVTISFSVQDAYQSWCKGNWRRGEGRQIHRVATLDKVSTLVPVVTHMFHSL